MPETEQPTALLAITCWCYFAAIGIATIASFALVLTPVAARQLHQLFSSRLHRVSPSPSRFSLLLLRCLSR
eukprot:7028000-Prymnesium_polylepis.1